MFCGDVCWPADYWSRLSIFLCSFISTSTLSYQSSFVLALYHKQRVALQSYEQPKMPIPAVILAIWIFRGAVVITGATALYQAYRDQHAHDDYNYYERTRFEYYSTAPRERRRYSNDISDDDESSEDGGRSSYQETPRYGIDGKTRLRERQHRQRRIEGP